jgi:hypothetical protein
MKRFILLALLFVTACSGAPFTLDGAWIGEAVTPLFIVPTQMQIRGKVATYFIKDEDNKWVYNGELNVSFKNGTLTLTGYTDTSTVRYIGSVSANTYKGEVWSSSESLGTVKLGTFSLEKKYSFD